MTDLRTQPELRIDFERIIDCGDEILTVELEGACESTRYHCLFVRRPDRMWWVMCENLQFALPLLPYLGGWHPGYIDSKLRVNRSIINDRTAVALVMLMEYAHDLVES